jgi:glycosyltransferase involved in cell wall biosynthesis
MILVSIVVPTFNARDTLKQCLDSVIGQTFPGKEIIVVDGGSTDGTIDLIKSYGPRIERWLSEPDRGVFDAFNKGIGLARGRWLYFLGADDYLYDRDVLLRFAPCLSKQPPDARLIYGRVALVAPGGDTIALLGEPWEITREKLPAYLSLSHQGVFHARELFVEHGLFDTSYRLSGDYEFLLRELLARDALFIPDVLVAGHRSGGISSLPGNHTRTLWELRRAQKTHGILMPRPAWFVRLLAAWARSGLVTLVGYRRGHLLIDHVRALLGKKPYWSRL